MSTIRNPGAVYRSTNPEHLDIVRRNQTNRAKAADAAEALVQELVPGAVSYGCCFEDDGFTVDGFVVESRDVEVPPGLRWDTKARGGALVLVPAKRTDEGKAIAKRLRHAGFAPESLGMVSRVITITDGENRWFSSAVIEVIGDEVYATYHHPIDDERRPQGRPSNRQRVEADPGWEPIPLSEFYAARESAGAQVAADGGR